MPRRRSERRLTPAEHAQYLYRASSDRFYADSGSLYPCSQGELDFHRRGRFLRKNRGPFVSLLKATEEVMVQNDERRRPSFAERTAISNLGYVAHDRNYRYHPDIVVKVFNDLDTVFFGGRLHGNVIVSWANSTQCTELQKEIGSRFLGSTQGHLPGEQGQARICLNPREMFLENLANETPLRAMFCTLIHEMVHAYEHVRCTKDPGSRDCHDEYFATKIDVIHQRALRILGMNIIGKWETYRQSLWFRNAVDDSYINLSPGTYGSSRHDDYYRDDFGRHGSTKNGRGRRDKRSRSRNGNMGDFNANVGGGACSVM